MLSTSVRRSSVGPWSSQLPTLLAAGRRTCGGRLRLVAPLSAADPLTRAASTPDRSPRSCRDTRSTMQVACDELRRGLDWTSRQADVTRKTARELDRTAPSS